MLNRRKRQQKFLNAVKNHFGWGVGFGKQVNVVWFNVSKHRRVYLEIIMAKAFTEERWNNQYVLVLPVKQVKVIEVQTRIVSYDLIMKGFTVPIDGQARKGSAFEFWLGHIDYVSRAVANQE